MQNAFKNQPTTLRAAICGALLVGACAAHATEIDGFTEPYRSIDVAAADSGLLDQVAVKEGDRVSRGQVLARLDEKVFQATIAIAESAMQSRGRLDSAQAEVALQTAMLAKLKELQQRNHASQQEVDRAETQLRIAQARLQTVREELQINALEHERALMQLQQRRLVAPIDGIVTRVYKDRGEYVSLNEPIVLKVVQLDSLLVVFSVPIEYCRELSVGQVVNVRIALVDEPAQAEVEFISPTADPQSGTARVRVRVPNPGETLPSGAACRLVLPSQPLATASRPGH